MQAMLYRDRDEGPCLEEVLGGIQAADGHPGALVEWLRAIPLGHKGGATSLVHESSPEDLATSAAPERPLAQRRVSAALHGAAARAERLAARGRHAGAIRALDRAIRVLEGRADRWMPRVARWPLDGFFGIGAETPKRRSSSSTPGH